MDRPWQLYWASKAHWNLKRCRHCGSTRRSRKTSGCLDCHNRKRMQRYYEEMLARYWTSMSIP